MLCTKTSMAAELYWKIISSRLNYIEIILEFDSIMLVINLEVIGYIGYGITEKMATLFLFILLWLNAVLRMIIGFNIRLFVYFYLLIFLYQFASGTKDFVLIFYPY